MLKPILQICSWMHHSGSAIVISSVGSDTILSALRVDIGPLLEQPLDDLASTSGHCYTSGGNCYTPGVTTMPAIILCSALSAASPAASVPMFGAIQGQSYPECSLESRP